MHALEAELKRTSLRRQPNITLLPSCTRERGGAKPPDVDQSKHRNKQLELKPHFLYRFSTVNFVLSPEGPLTGTGVTGTGCADFLYIPSLLPPQQTTVQQPPPTANQPAPVAATPSMSRGEMCGNLTGNSFICTYRRQIEWDRLSKLTSSHWKLISKHIFFKRLKLTYTPFIIQTTFLTLKLCSVLSSS